MDSFLTLSGVLLIAALTTTSAARVCTFQNPCYSKWRSFHAYSGFKSFIPDNPHCAMRAVTTSPGSCLIDLCHYRDDCDPSVELTGRPGEAMQNSCGSSWTIGPSCSFSEYKWDPTSYHAIQPGSLYNDDCVGDLDICFAIDESGSLKRSDFGAEINFVRALTAKLVQRMPLGKLPRFSGFLFDQNVFGWNDIIHADPTSDYSEFLDNLNDRYFDGGWTNISSGLANCRGSLEDHERKRVTFLLTDGMQTVGANGDSRNYWVYNSYSRDWNGTIERAIVEQLATDMKDDGVTIAVLGVFDKNIGLSPEYSDFFRKIASTAVAPRAATSPSAQEDNSLLYSFDFDDLDTIASEIMAEEICDTGVIGTVTEDDTCNCVRHTVSNPGYCVRLVDTSNGDMTICEYDTCEKERYTCDVNSGEAVCQLVQDTAFVCREGTHRADGTCDCDQKAIERLANISPPPPRKL